MGECGGLSGKRKDECELWEEMTLEGIFLLISAR